MKTKQRSKTRTAKEKTAAVRIAKTASKFFSQEDPNGSYTGNAIDGKPVQDVDDL